jgi:REP element-mobilizing transposase RayT
MKYNREIHHRHSIRLEAFDYSSPGYYFITICSQNRESLYGNISQDSMVLNDSGEMIKAQWTNLTQRFSHICLDRFVIMPNHFHGIIHITGGPPFHAISDYLKNRVHIINDPDLYEPPHGTAEKTISRIIQAFKSITTVHYCQSVHQHHWPPFNKHLWQKNFYDHIIRDDEELEIFRRYIMDNPSHWKNDEDNPINFKK